MRFDSYHPAINFIFFTAVILAAVTFDHPVFVLLGYLCPFLYSVALEGRRALRFDLLLLPLMALYTVFYAYYHHFGVTELSVNFVGNHTTLEAIVYGTVLSVKIASVLMWCRCLHAVISSDKVVYLLGRCCPRLSVYVAILLRMAPRVRERWQKVEDARRCIGRSAREGGAAARLRNALGAVSVVTTWTLEDFMGSSESMRSRGYALKGRTAFSIYRFDNRDRCLVVTLFALFTVLLMGVLLDQTRTLYAPRIQINPVSRWSYVFYAAYVLTCLLPLGLQLAGEWRCRRLIRRASEG